VSLGPSNKRVVVTLVHNIYIDTMLKKQLNYLNFAMLDSVKDWSLPIIVNKIVICPEFDKLSDSIYPALTTGIKERTLPISINLIYVAAILDKEVDKLVFTFS
jgi:hypothetical protein